MEGSHSGLVRGPGKAVCPKGHRGFESLSFRLRLAGYLRNIFPAVGLKGKEYIEVREKV